MVDTPYAASGMRRAVRRNFSLLLLRFFSFSRFSLGPAFLITSCFFLLGFVHWFGSLDGMRGNRFQLRVLKRMYQYRYTTYARLLSI